MFWGGVFKADQVVWFDSCYISHSLRCWDRNSWTVQTRRSSRCLSGDSPPSTCSTKPVSCTKRQMTPPKASGWNTQVLPSQSSVPFSGGFEILVLCLSRAPCSLHTHCIIIFLSHSFSEITSGPSEWMRFSTVLTIQGMSVSTSSIYMFKSVRSFNLWLSPYDDLR